jgi:hypothetical protein
MNEPQNAQRWTARTSKKCQNIFIIDVASIHQFSFFANLYIKLQIHIELNEVDVWYIYQYYLYRSIKYLGVRLLVKIISEWHWLATVVTKENIKNVHRAKISAFAPQNSCQILMSNQKVFYIWCLSNSVCLETRLQWYCDWDSKGD